MPTRLFLVPLLIMAAIAAALSPSPAQAQLGVNIFGLSKHFEPGDRDIAEVNPGLGLHWTFDRGRRTAWEFSAGVYRDSFRNLDRHLSLGARWRIAGPLELAMQAMWSSSKSLNSGQAVLKPLPSLSLRSRYIVLHAIYLPEVGGFNGVETLGFMATVYPFGDEFAWNRMPEGWDTRRTELEFGWHMISEARQYRDYRIAWRRMRNERNGWRIGVDLFGILASENSFHDNHYRFAVLWQRIWERPLRDRLAAYTALGARVSFSTTDDFGGSANTSRLAIPLNLGLGAQFADGLTAFVETGLELVRTTEYEDTYDKIVRRGVSLRGARTILGLRARY